MRYTCYHDSMHLLTCSLCQVTMAKYSRCRLLYSGREVQQPMDWKCTWYYVEIANGERGFIPGCITTTHTSDFNSLFWQTGHGRYHGYESSLTSFNRKWSAYGMAGEGVGQLLENWGDGGHDVLPEIFSLTFDTEWDADNPWANPEGKCRRCKQSKPQVAFSRYQWGLRKFTSAKEWGNQALCIECEKSEVDGFCTCNRVLEVWMLCETCAGRAKKASGDAHAHAVSMATKHRNIK